MADLPYVEIVEQPAEKSMRFRYESEQRLTSTIHGVNSTADKPSYPKIKIGNFTGKVQIILSCVTHEKPYMQHPHKIRSKGRLNEYGISIMERTIHQEEIIEFKDIAIVFVKKTEIDASLKVRRDHNIDPTKGGFKHIGKPQLIELNSVRFCFQVIEVIDSSRRRVIGCQTSSIVKNKYTNGPLKIVDISSKMSPANGGEHIIILCDKVKREDISVVFYEEEETTGNVLWEEKIDYKNQPNQFKVHHQYAISFSTPKYKDVDIVQTRRTFLQLRRLVNDERSDPISFQFIPIAQNSVPLQRKKQHKKMLKSGEMNVIGSIKEKLISSVNNVKKAETPQVKSNYAPDLLVENILLEIKTDCPVERSAPPPPQPLIDLFDNDKENVPQMNVHQNVHQNVHTQDVHQSQAYNDLHRRQQAFDGQHGQYAQFSCNTPRANEMPLYYYPYSQQQNYNGHYGEQTSYNQRLILPNVYQQPQQRAAMPSHSNYSQIDACTAHVQAGNMNTNHPMNMSNINANNCMTMTYNNQMNLNVNATTDAARPISNHSETNGINLSDLLQSNTNDLMKVQNVDDYLSSSMELMSVQNDN